jgi:hypothetical protein
MISRDPARELGVNDNNTEHEEDSEEVMKEKVKKENASVTN